MKTKEELLRIYSAYLPYELKVEIIDNPCKGEIKKLSGIMEFGLCFLGKGGRFGFHERSIENIKPILYSMDMLTKEIEHKGERFIPAEILFGGLKPKEAKKNYTKDCERWPLLMTYQVTQLLIEWHFNVFGLYESEYIKKENLN